MGDHIRTKRLDMGLEQKDVALLIGVDTCTILNWEKNRCQPEIQHYPKIFNYLGYCFIQYPKTEGERLRLFRTNRGLTIKELAKFIGVDPASIQAWEADKRVPSRKAREKMEKLWLRKD
jgi:transcriptional regulator with XRE-family HTH domain